MRAPQDGIPAELGEYGSGRLKAAIDEHGKQQKALREASVRARDLRSASFRGVGAPGEKARAAQDAAEQYRLTGLALSKAAADVERLFASERPELEANIRTAADEAKLVALASLDAAVSALADLSRLGGFLGFVDGGKLIGPRYEVDDLPRATFAAELLGMIRTAVERRNGDGTLPARPPRELPPDSQAWATAVRHDMAVG